MSGLRQLTDIADNNALRVHIKQRETQAGDCYLLRVCDSEGVQSTSKCGCALHWAVQRRSPSIVRRSLVNRSVVALWQPHCLLKEESSPSSKDLDRLESVPLIPNSTSPAWDVASLLSSAKAVRRLFDRSKLDVASCMLATMILFLILYVSCYGLICLCC